MENRRWTVYVDRRWFIPVDCVNGQDSIAAHITVTVLQTGPDGRHERLEQLRLLQFAQETQCGATDELIGMLQVLQLKEIFHISSDKYSIFRTISMTFFIVCLVLWLIVRLEMFHRPKGRGGRKKRKEKKKGL